MLFWNSLRCWQFDLWFLSFSKTSLNIWKFTVHVLLKPGLENFEHYFTGIWDECSCAVICFLSSVPFSSVAQSCLTLSNPWITTRQASLSITNSQSSLRLTSIESVMPSSHLILCRPLLLLPSIFPSIKVHSISQFFISGDKSIAVSVSISASAFPMNIQDWFPLGLTGWISLQFKGLSRVFSNTTVEKHQFGTQLSSQSNSHIHTWPLEKP